MELTREAVWESTNRKLPVCTKDYLAPIQNWMRLEDGVFNVTTGTLGNRFARYILYSHPLVGKALGWLTTDVSKQYWKLTGALHEPMKNHLLAVGSSTCK